MVVNQQGTISVRVKAPAKINIGLQILEKRADGYHEIRSVLQQINLYDEITLQRVPDSSLSLSCNQLDLPLGKENLCIQAAELLRWSTDCHLGVKMFLTKRIPWGAGLGGGSSDAAAVLKALNELWKLGLKKGELIKLASELGSDVPFFIEGGCCLATGRGEKLKKIKPIITDPILLICPEISISTAWAYKNIKKYRLTSKKENITFYDSLTKGLFDPSARDVFRNDFESIVVQEYPLLKSLIARLYHYGAYFASLSGSGSSLYGVFSNKETAVQAAIELSDQKRNFLLYPAD